MAGFGFADPGQSEGAYQRELGMRLKILSSTSPWLGSDPDLMRAMVLDGTVDTQTLAHRSASVAGMMDMDRLYSRMQQLPDPVQRAMYAQLTPAQQNSIGQLGYSTPHRQEAHGVGGLFGAIGSVTGAISGGIGSGIGAVADPVLSGLNQVANVPGFLYRSLRTMDVKDQIVGFLAGSAAAAGIALAPFTAGASLGVTAAAAGVGGLLVGNAAAAGSAAITNSTDWWDSARNAWNGEHIFSADAQNRAAAILKGNSTIFNLAKDMAYEGGIDEMAQDFAEVRDSTSGNAMLGSVERIVLKMVDRQDPRFDDLVDQVSKLAQNDDFREAVSTLQNGKISFGRDLANSLHMSPDNRMYDLVSGVADGLFTVGLDPILAAGAANKAWKLTRFALPESDAVTAAEFVNNLLSTNRSVKRAHTILAEAVDTGDFSRAKRFMPESQSMWDSLIDFRNARRDGGETVFDLDSMRAWYDEGGGLTGLLKGQGTVKGQSRVMLANSTAPSVQWSNFKSWASATIDFADSKASEKAMRKMIDLSNDVQVKRHLDQTSVLPDTVLAKSGLAYDMTLTPGLAERYRNTAAVVEFLDNAPLISKLTGPILRTGGSLGGTMTRMIPHGGFVHLEGPEAAGEIDKFVDLGRVAGMKASTMDVWKNFILNQNNPALRRVALQSYLKTMLQVGGLELTDAGRELMQTFVRKQGQTFGLGGLDELVVNGMKMSAGILPIADQAAGLALPNLKNLRQAVQKGSFLKYVFNVGDAQMLDEAMTKIWKPAVLLRVGFIPRAAGEELLSFFAREGVSAYIAGFGVRSVMEGKIARNPEAYGTFAASMPERIEHWNSVAHLRPLERIISRFNGPTEMIEKYSTWLRDGLERGVMPKSLTDNLPERWNQALLGKSRSLRRLVLTGIDPELMRATEAYYSNHGQALIKAITAQHAGLLDLAQPEKLIRGPGLDEYGNMIDQPMVLDQHNMQYIEEAGPDPFYRAGYMAGLQHFVSDPVMSQAIAPVMARILPKGLKREAMDVLHDTYSKVYSPEIKSLLDMALKTDHKSAAWGQGWLNKWEGSFSEQEMDALRAWMPGQAATGEEIFESVIRSGVFNASIDQYSINNARSVLKELNTMNPDQRGWANLYLPHRPKIPNLRASTIETMTPMERSELEHLTEQSQRFPVRAGGPEVPGGFNEPLTPREREVAATRERDTRRLEELSSKSDRIRRGIPPDTAEEASARRLVGMNEAAGGVGFQHPTGLQGYDVSGNDIIRDSGELTGFRNDVDRSTAWLAKRDLTTNERKLVDQVRDYNAHNEFNPWGYDTEEMWVDGQFSHKSYQIAKRDKEWASDLSDLMRRELKKIEGRTGPTQEYWLTPRAAEEQMLDATRALQLDPENQIALRGSIHNIQNAEGMPVAQPLDFRRMYNPYLHADNASKLTGGLRADARIRELRASGLTVQDTIKTALKERLEELPRRMWRDPEATRMAHDWIDNFVERYFPEKNAIYLDEYINDALQGIPDRVVMVGGEHLSDPRVASDLSQTLQSYVSKNRSAAARNNGSGVAFHNIYADTAPRRFNVDPLVSNGSAHLVPKGAEYHHVGDGQWVHGTTLEESVDSWSKVQLARWKQLAREDVRTTLVARDIDQLYRKEGSRFVNMLDDEQALKGSTYYRYDQKKKDFVQVKWGDTNYFTTGQTTHGEGYLWDQIGPALRDAMDEHTGRAMFGPDGERLFHYTMDDVGNATGHLPNFVFAPQMKPPREVGRWEKVVQYGFNRMISPALDAIVRRPMAFHQFTEAYMANQRAFRWFLDADLFDGTIPKVFANSWGSRAAGLHGRQRIVDEAKSLNNFLDHDISNLSESEVMGYLHSLGTAELQKVATRVSRGGPGLNEERRAIHHLLGTNPQAFRFGVDGIDAHVEFARSLLDEIPKRVLNMSWERARLESSIGDLVVNNRALYEDLDEKSWTALQRASRNLKWTDEQVVQSAVERGITNTVPFIDSHEFKSQFAEYGKSMMPFWYAEENFFKRWGRTLAMNPEAVRKGQLTYLAMKNVGVVRTDSQGNDWFIYPGSEVVASALGQIPGLNILPIGAAFQTQTTQMLPGFNENVGTPSFSPFVTLPTSTIATLLPETKPLFQAFLGPYNMNRGIANQIIPAQVRSFWEAFTADDGDVKYASAMMAAASILEANGKAPPPDATSDQLNDYMDTLRKHARTILLARAITGFVSPGTPSEIDTQNTGFAGIGAQDKSRLLREEYLTLIRQQGIDEGTVAYLANHDEASPEHLVNPLAYTVGQSKSTSGAPLPATREAVSFYQDNRNWMEEFPNAGPWMLPPDQSAGSAVEQDAYTQQTIDGLRERVSPDDFVRSIRFKAGATEYFRMRDAYLNAVSQAQDQDDQVWRRDIENQWTLWSASFKATHPVFAEELLSGDGRQRRQATITELRFAVNDPEAPQPWHAEAVRTAVNVFTSYQAMLAEISVSRTAQSQADADELKSKYSTWMDRYVFDHPEIEPLWTSVLKPEASLD